MSRALVLIVDERRVAYTSARVPRHPTFVNSQGNVQVLPNGNVLVGWGGQPYFSEFSPEGELLFDARLGEQLHLLPRLPHAMGQRRVGRPAVAARRAATHTTAYVSWNGDTSVAHWAPLVGPTAGT